MGTELYGDYSAIGQNDSKTAEDNREAQRKIREAGSIGRIN